jgi:hypothetical protein
MRYFRRTDEGHHARGVNWGGDPTYWLEVNERGDAERELQVYPNGNVLRYDRAHPRDEYGGLAVMVVDGDEVVWVAYEVTREEFEEQWRAHAPPNRGAEPDGGATRRVDDR